MCLEERVSVSGTLMKLEDRHLGGERGTEISEAGPYWSLGGKSRRTELEYKTAGLAVEICTNQICLFNASEKQNLDILNSKQKFKGQFLKFSFVFTMQFLASSMSI